MTTNLTGGALRLTKKRSGVRVTLKPETDSERLSSLIEEGFFGDTILYPAEVKWKGRSYEVLLVPTVIGAKLYCKSAWDPNKRPKIKQSLVDTVGRLGSEILYESADVLIEYVS